MGKGFGKSTSTPGNGSTGKGFTDKPTNTLEDDSFGIEKYIDGLKEFILKCNTPMTIAIQGDWGSGKTSMMNMIKAQLGDQVVTSWFNTWQYSQFNMGDALAVSFLARLLSDLTTEQGKKSEKAQKMMQTLTHFAKKFAVIITEAAIGQNSAQVVKEVTNQSTEEQQVDLPEAISKLKEEFQAAVNERVNQAGKDRLVIFVDDLDRLHPGKAVELLEVLKLFLDCEHCVFVLAIDYAVVSQGVKQKYGELIGEEKGKSFFDKIIQVPFKMPVAQYDVKNYVASSLETLDIPISESEVESYVKLIQRSVGCNPRAMKRLFNAFLLLNKIAANDINNKGAQKNTLFAILCLQLSFEALYNYIVQKAEDCKDDDFLKKLRDPATYTDESEGENLAHELHLNPETDVAGAAEFMKAFFEVIDQNGNGSLSDAEREDFIKTLRFSTITSNTATAGETMTTDERAYRTFNNGVAKDIIKKVQGDSKGPWKVFMARTYNNHAWKIHYAGGKREFETPFGNVIFEFKIATDLSTKKAPLILHVYPDVKADAHAFDQCMQGLYACGFTKREDGYWLNNKTVDDADTKEEIKEEISAYFADEIPAVTRAIETALQA